MADTEYTKGYRAGYDFARAETEARIIKWLESKSECTPMRGHDWSGDCYCETIALIKGGK
jgi:hypothetical protein